MKQKTEYQDIRGNRTHKADVFAMAFKNKKDLLDLYNAVNGTDYDNIDDLEVNTLDNVLYMSMKNDVSFMIGCTMNLYEHQSSYNPNMPLRGLLYFSKLFNKYANQRKLNLYSSTLQKIPTPKYIVFYNGMKQEPDRQVLRLSDAFEGSDGCLECTALMLNINYGHNRRLMEKCRRLEEYAIFVGTVRKYAAIEHFTLEDSIAMAVEECINSGILVDVLKEQRAEVFEVILETFDKELYERDLRANIRAEVREEIKSEVIEEVKAEVKKELRSEVETEVKNEIRSEVKAEVKNEIRSEVKAEIEAELKEKHEQRFLQLISNMAADGIASEIPRLSKEPEFLENMYKKYQL